MWWKRLKNIKIQIIKEKIGEKILLSLALFCILNLNLNALTMKEKIQQDLSKIGINEKIIFIKKNMKKELTII